MKRSLFIIILMVFVGSTAVFADPPVVSSLTTAEASQKISESSGKIRKVVGSIKNNFQADSDFTRMIDFLYITYMRNRLQISSAIFPDLYEFNDPEYKKSYYSLTADFTVGQDNKFINSYRDLITPYCNYSVKYKSTTACTSERIDSLFKTD